jgi:hypothetical protein
MAQTLKRNGYLTIYSSEGTEIYGEFADAEWDDQEVLSGMASEGTYETFRRLNMSGIEHVRYKFDASDGTFEGVARLLATERAPAPASAIVRIELL